MNAEVASQLDPQAVARVPRQQRALERFEAVIREAELVLEEKGIQEFSIPVIAERLNMTRGSVYAYFPTTYAIINELVRRHVGGMEKIYIDRAEEMQGMTWWDGIDWAINLAVDYHNQHAAARILMLGGAVTESSFSALETLLKRLGMLVRQIWMAGQSDRKAPPADPDVFTLAIDIGLACFRRSNFEHGYITPAYRDEAVRAMRYYLQSHIDSLR